MKHIEVYSTKICPYCVLVKNALIKKGVAFTEIDVSHDPDAREALVIKAGGRKTVPQIFIDGVHLGEEDEFFALEKEGKLDKILGIA